MRNIFPILHMSKILSHNGEIHWSIENLQMFSFEMSQVLALTCRTLKTSADQTEPQFVSAWRGEMWKKQNGGEVPKCWKCMKCWLLLLIVDLGTCPCKFLWKDRHCKCKALKFSSRGLRLIPCGCMLSYFQVGTRKTVWPFWENTHQLLVPKTVAAGATVYNFCSNPFYVFIYVAHWIYPFIIIQWIYPFVIRILSNPLIFIVAHIFEFFAKTNRTVVKPFKRASSRPPEENATAETAAMYGECRCKRTEAETGVKWIDLRGKWRKDKVFSPKFSCFVWQFLQPILKKW